MERPKSFGALTAVAIAAKGKAPVQLGAWCPYCERVHAHGAEGSGEPRVTHRGAHCEGYGARSPFERRGYELHVTGTVATWDAAEPPALMAKRATGSGAPDRARRRLVDQLSLAAGRLAGSALAAIMGSPHARVRSATRRCGGARVDAEASGTWEIETGGRIRRGRGLLALSAQLYGVSAGVAALRFLEAVTSDCLDSEAALELVAVVDAWAERGAPRRDARP